MHCRNDCTELRKHDADNEIYIILLLCSDECCDSVESCVQVAVILYPIVRCGILLYSLAQYTWTDYTDPTGFWLISDTITANLNTSPKHAIRRTARASAATIPTTATEAEMVLIGSIIARIARHDVRASRTRAPRRSVFVRFRQFSFFFSGIYCIDFVLFFLIFFFFFPIRYFVIDWFIYLCLISVLRIWYIDYCYYYYYEHHQLLLEITKASISMPISVERWCTIIKYDFFRTLLFTPTELLCHLLFAPLNYIYNLYIYVQTLCAATRCKK